MSARISAPKSSSPILELVNLKILKLISLTLDLFAIL
jgi:hypothetical protein